MHKLINLGLSYEGQAVLDLLCNVSICQTLVQYNYLPVLQTLNVARFSTENASTCDVSEKWCGVCVSVCCYENKERHVKNKIHSKTVFLSLLPTILFLSYILAPNTGVAKRVGPRFR